MIEENQLKYIRWEQCTKRDQELMGIKCDPTWKPDSQGVIREVKVQQEVRADTSSDLRLKYALHRRSLAIDQGRLCDYDKMEKWSCILLEAYSKAPIPGYQRVTIEQIQHADMEMFKYLIKNTRGGVRPTAGKAPIETALDTALTLPEIRLHLQPLPAGAKRKLDDEDSTSKPSNMDKKQKPPSQSSETERLRRHVEKSTRPAQECQRWQRARQGQVQERWSAAFPNPDASRINRSEGYHSLRPTNLLQL